MTDERRITTLEEHLDFLVQLKREMEATDDAMGLRRHLPKLECQIRFVQTLIQERRG